MTTARKSSSFLGALAVLAACAGSGPTSESAAAGWSGAPTDSDPAQIESGRRIAQAQCASCHAIDKTSASPLAAAPPLRMVLATYDSDNLAYRFIEGMRVGHDDMPLFDFDVRTADDLLAYILSIGTS